MSCTISVPEATIGFICIQPAESPHIPEFLSKFPEYLIDRIKTHSLYSISYHIQCYLIGLYTYNCSIINCFICNNNIESNKSIEWKLGFCGRLGIIGCWPSSRDDNFGSGQWPRSCPWFPWYSNYTTVLTTSHKLCSENEELLSCTNPSMLCMGKGLVPDRQQASVDTHDDLMFIHEISHVSRIKMGVCDRSVIWELIYLDGMMGTVVFPVHLHWRYCSLALGHPYSVKTWLAPGHSLYFMLNLYIPMKLTICEELIWQWVWYIYCHIQAYISGGLDVGLQCLQRIRNGDTLGLHWSIHIVFRQWPCAWLTPAPWIYL